MEDDNIVNFNEAVIERLLLAVPHNIREIRQWLMWRWEAAEKPGDKPRKVPYYASGSKRFGTQGQPEDWARFVTFDQAIEALRTNNFTGVGIAFAQGSRINAADFDNCVTRDADNKAVIEPEVMELCRQTGSYAEISPSGNGVRLLGFGDLSSKKNVTAGGNVELFGNSGFVTITGSVICAEEVREWTPGARATLLSWAHNDGNASKRQRNEQLTKVRGVDPVYIRLQGTKRIKREWPDGRVSIVCPFESEHTSGSGNSDTVYFLPFTNGYARGHFQCMHAHCNNRTDQDFLTAIGYAPGSSASGLLLDIPQLREAAGTITWLVKKVIPANSVGILFGPSGTFKSFIAIDLALTVAHGGKWLGRKTQRGAVIYVAGEGGTGLIRRIDAWHKRHGTEPGNVPFRACVVALQLDQDRDLQMLSQAIEAESEHISAPALVVIDTVSQTMSGDENSNQEMARYLRGIGAELRARHGSAVLCIHHTGKDVSRGERGASVIRGNTDFVLGVERIEGQMQAVLSNHKQKDEELAPEVLFGLERLELGKDEDGEAITSLVAAEIDNAKKLLQNHANKLSAYAQTILAIVGTSQSFDKHALRQEFYQRHSELMGDNKRKALSRTLEDLVKRGILLEDQRSVGFRE